MRTPSLLPGSKSPARFNFIDDNLSYHPPCDFKVCRGRTACARILAFVRVSTLCAMADRGSRTIPAPIYARTQSAPHRFEAANEGQSPSCRF
jgi:hypothetical protein